jgi:hypothetical protein
MAKTKLNQVIAVVSGQKSEAEKTLTEVYHAFQKGELFTGLARTYTPRNADDGDTKPPERKAAQASVRDLYQKAAAVLTRLMNNVATQDWGNCEARADVVANGTVLLRDVPVTHLLFLEHKLADLKAFVDKMPVRDPAEEWRENPESASFATDPVRTEVTRKVQVPIVLYDATDKHPAQTQLITRDDVVGHWDTKKFSTAVSNKDKETMLARVVQLAEAVKAAREEANSIVVDRKEVAAPILDFVFGGVLK